MSQRYSDCVHSTANRARQPKCPHCKLEGSSFNYCGAFYTAKDEAARLAQSESTWIWPCLRATPPQPSAPPAEEKQP